jgi:DeoR/GlpR family transcriptional regulator of sugar metabolism
VTRQGAAQAVSPDTPSAGTPNARDRRIRILELLQDREFVSVAELAGLFGMTDMSVRRDLNALAEIGRVNRVRGGATATHAIRITPPFAAARARNAPEKALIARRAAALIEPGSAVFFYSGSTVAEVAAKLPGQVRQSLTVVTNSLAVIDEVGAWPSPHLIGVGGIYLPDYMAFVGPYAIGALRGLHVDVAIVGTDGLSAAAGLTIAHQLIAEIGAIMIERARRTVVVADSTKIGRAGFTPIVPIRAVDVLVTDTDADPGEVSALRALGVEVILA